MTFTDDFRRDAVDPPPPVAVFTGLRWALCGVLVQTGPWYEVVLSEGELCDLVEA